LYSNRIFISVKLDRIGKEQGSKRAENKRGITHCGPQGNRGQDMGEKEKRERLGYGKTEDKRKKGESESRPQDWGAQGGTVCTRGPLKNSEPHKVAPRAHEHNEIHNFSLFLGIFTSNPGSHLYLRLTAYPTGCLRLVESRMRSLRVQTPPASG